MATTVRGASALLAVGLISIALLKNYRSRLRLRPIESDALRPPNKSKSTTEASTESEPLPAPTSTSPHPPLVEPDNARQPPAREKAGENFGARSDSFPEPPGPPPLSSEWMRELASTSDSVAPALSDLAGRGLFALRTIDEGEVVLRVQPTVIAPCWPCENPSESLTPEETATVR
jgi:hypothetical protein